MKTTITVKIDDNGTGKVPNDKLQRKCPRNRNSNRTNKKPSQVPVETPAHKTPTIDVEQDPKTGDVNSNT